MFFHQAPERLKLKWFSSSDKELLTSADGTEM